MAQKGVIKTQEKFVQDVERKFPGKYTILGKYTGSTGYLEVVYNKCGHTCNTKACKIMAGKGCPVCFGGIKLSQEQFEDRVHNLFPDYEVTGTYVNNITPISVRHICGYEFDIIPSNMYGKKQCNCPKCFNKNHNCIPYVNDIYTTNKEMYNILKNKEDGHKYKAGSHKNLWFVCPYCDNEVLQTPYSVNHFGLQCPKCNSNISFPERLMSVILTKCNVNYQFQFNPEWIKPYRYDFECKLQNNDYIIEMDGGWHFQNNNLSNCSVKKIQERDKYKDKLAVKHGYHMIRIDCNYIGDSREIYIKEKILQSELSNLIDLDNINWDECFYLANLPIIKVITDEWNNGIKSIPELAKKLHLSCITIRRYLYKASENNIIDESIEDIKQLNIQHRINTYEHPRNIKIICNETGEIFKNLKEAQEKYHCNISNYFRESNRKYAGQLPDGTRLTWTKL